MVFSLITYNVKGMRDSSKRQQIFNYLKNHMHNGIFFLQETHSTPDDEEKWKTEWGGELFFSHGKSNSKGVLTGFTKNIDAQITKNTYDKNGRILLTDAIIDSHKYIQRQY